MNKVLIDRELLERVKTLCEEWFVRGQQPHMSATDYKVWHAIGFGSKAFDGLRTALAAPSGTPAMPVKAYYHEAPNEYGGLNKSVGLEVRKEFADAPLVLESDALARIACLEGEIAKRDARILELESQYQRDVYGLNNEGDPIGGDPAGGYANDNARLRAELSAIKAQSVVMPERWNVPRPMWKDARQPYGNPLNHADIEAAEKFNLALDEVARLNAAPVQQVSVPTWMASSRAFADRLYMAGWRDLADAQHSGVAGVTDELLSSSPAAPAADAPSVEMVQAACAAFRMDISPMLAMHDALCAALANRINAAPVSAGGVDDRAAFEAWMVDVEGVRIKPRFDRATAGPFAGDYRDGQVQGAHEKVGRYADQRDQQAQRIGELEGLLLRVQVSLSLDDTEWGYSGAEKYKLLADIRAALSAGKEGE